MTGSKLFSAADHGAVERAIVALINSQPEFLSSRTAGSPRAVGDAIQDIIAENFHAILGERCRDYSTDFARRAMADLAFNDAEGHYCVVDVKTHRLGTKFNMPNLTSVERLARFYEDDANYFVVLMVAYTVDGTRILAKEAHFVPIEFLSWDCLTVGALGWGQIQIANANVLHIIEGHSRKKWMIELCDTLLEFYPKEIGKIEERREHFRRVRQRWQEKVGD